MPTNPLTDLFIALSCYLLGSVPFGVVIAHFAGLGDIRKIGSGNIGATNVLRTGNRLAALGTLIGDGAKGTLAVLIGRWLAGETGAVIAAATSFAGHVFPVWLRFKGGKGVATFLGINLGLCFPAGLATCATWLGVAYLSRFSSLSALAAAAAAPVYLALAELRLPAQIVAVLTLLIFWRHAANIKRLVAGTEPRIGEKKTDPAA